MRRCRLWLTLVIVIMIAASILAACSSPADTNIPDDTPQVPDGYMQEKAHFQIDDGDGLVYLRAMVIVNWQNEDGVVSFTQPVQDVDYTLDVSPAIWSSKMTDSTIIRTRCQAMTSLLICL